MDNYINTLIIKSSPEKIYDAITTEKGLANWWTKNVEFYPHIGGTGTFRFEKDTYAVMKIGKLLLNKEVVWKCVEQHSPTRGTDKTDEWVGTTVKFVIIANPDGTTSLSFTHEGLTPDLFCYKECKKGWDYFLNSLKQYVETGKGKPYTDK